LSRKTGSSSHSNHHNSISHHPYNHHINNNNNNSLSNLNSLNLTLNKQLLQLSRQAADKQPLERVRSKMAQWQSTQLNESSANSLAAEMATNDFSTANSVAISKKKLLLGLAMNRLSSSRSPSPCSLPSSPPSSSDVSPRQLALLPVNLSCGSRSSPSAASCMSSSGHSSTSGSPSPHTISTHHHSNGSSSGHSIGSATSTSPAIEPIKPRGRQKPKPPPITALQPRSPTRFAGYPAPLQTPVVNFASPFLPKSAGGASQLVSSAAALSNLWNCVSPLMLSPLPVSSAGLASALSKAQFTNAANASSHFQFPTTSAALANLALNSAAAAAAAAVVSSSSGVMTSSMPPYSPLLDPQLIFSPPANSKSISVHQ
jgi:hypothetical protein